MKKIVFFLIITLFLKLSGQNTETYKEEDFNHNEILYKTIVEVNELAESYNFHVEKQYSIKTLLGRIIFFENLSKEIENEKDLKVQEGLVKSLMISLQPLSITSGVELINDSDSIKNITQIVSGFLQAQRRMLVLQMWTEVNHFLIEKKYELLNK
ncbi:hypothetical protein [Chryseobacterium sp. 8AT]|uniref:hypothetical protein n=1 Tax=Chryseobacterium sp. 8AT TaxID=2653134 RepID=UPI0012F452F1|nr:hypothetical protein [Chryseobacterium sp. 8AT]VXB04699.1 hypothetical protein CHRYSEO8AT_10297 [Chryseobacterium sp. 8AT]